MQNIFRALVVDDERDIRRLVVHALELRGFVCDAAKNGQEASNLLARGQYDLVVTDLQMPDRHGHSLAVEVLELGPNRPLVVVLTGVLEPRLAIDLMARGVDDVVYKPIDFDVFGAKSASLCTRRKQLAESTEECDSPGTEIARTGPGVPAATDAQNLAVAIEEKVHAAEDMLKTGSDLHSVLSALKLDEPSFERWQEQRTGAPPVNDKRLENLEEEIHLLRQFLSEQASDIESLKRIVGTAPSNAAAPADRISA